MSSATPPSPAVPVEEKVTDLPATLAPEALDTIPLDNVNVKTEKEAEAIHEANGKEPDVYDRFTPRKKKIILCIVALAAFLGREYRISRSAAILPLPVDTSTLPTL